MARLNFMVTTLLLTAACSRPDATPPVAATPDWSVSAAAIGTTRFGQPMAEFAKAQGAQPDTTVGSECEYWWPAGAPAGLSLMVDSGKVVRVDVDSTGPRTARGIGLGATIAEATAAYPGLQSAPHKYNYDMGWRTLTVVEADSSAAIVFEVDSTVVRQFHAGRLPHALWVERCS
jgi:hypothetical protein